MFKLSYLVFILVIFITTDISASNRITPITQAVNLTQHSVVNIRTEEIVNSSRSPYVDPFFNDFFGYHSSYRTQSIGSGVIISKDGLIITNSHVVDRASKIFVILTDNRQLEAEIIGNDQILDIALIKIKGDISDLQPAIMGSSRDIMLGESVIAIGNPYGLNSSVTTGVVSAVRRVVKDDNGFAIFVQVDASINHGNSGGPLINLDGEVIGINTAIYGEAQGIGFSIPIDAIKRAVPEFLRYTKIRQGYPTFTIRERILDQASSLEVAFIEQESILKSRGVNIGDQLVMLDGISINSKIAFDYIVKTFPIGKKVRAVFDVNGKREEMLVEISPYSKGFVFKNLEKRYGLTFAKSNNRIVIKTSGIQKFIRSGDILVGINDRNIYTYDDIEERLSSHIGEVMIFNMVRGNRLFSVRLQT